MRCSTARSWLDGVSIFNREFRWTRRKRWRGKHVQLHHNLYYKLKYIFKYNLYKAGSASRGWGQVRSRSLSPAPS